MTDDRGVLGTGVGFPFTATRAGSVALASGTEDVEQAIRILLSTAPGERVMRPNYGCGIHDLAFAVVDATTLTRVETTVREAIERWEPRVTVDSVAASPADVARGRLTVEVAYRIRATNEPGNLVYPFYVEGGP